MNYNEFGGDFLSKANYWKNQNPNYDKDIQYEIDDKELTTCFKDSDKCFVCTLIHICKYTYNTDELKQIKNEIINTIRNSPPEQLRSSPITRINRKIQGQTTSRRKGLNLAGDNRAFCINEAKFESLNDAEVFSVNDEDITFHLCNIHMPIIHLPSGIIGTLNNLEMQNLRDNFRARMLRFINERQFLNRKKTIAKKGIDVEYQNPIKKYDKQIKKLKTRNKKLEKQLKQVEANQKDKLLLERHGFYNRRQVEFGLPSNYSAKVNVYTPLKKRKKKLEEKIKECEGLYDPEGVLNKEKNRNKKLRIASKCHTDRYPGFNGAVVGTYKDYIDYEDKINSELMEMGGQELLNDYLEEREMFQYATELSKRIISAAQQNKFLGKSEFPTRNKIKRSIPTSDTPIVVQKGKKGKQVPGTQIVVQKSKKGKPKTVDIYINKQSGKPSLPPRPMRLNRDPVYEIIDYEYTNPFDGPEPEIEPRPKVFEPIPDPYSKGTELIPHTVSIIDDNDSYYFPLLHKKKGLKNKKLRSKLNQLKKDHRLTKENINTIVIGFISINYQETWDQIRLELEHNRGNIEMIEINKATYINNNQHIVEVNKGDIESWFTDYVKYYDQLINCFKLVAGEKKKCKTPKSYNKWLVNNKKCGVLEFARKYAKNMNEKGGGEDSDTEEEEIGYYSKNDDGHHIVKLPQVEIKTCDKDIFKIYNPYIEYRYNPNDGTIYGTNSKYYYQKITTGQDDISKYCRENLQNKIKLYEALPGSIDRIFHIQGVSSAYTNHPRIEWFVEIGEDDKDYKSFSQNGHKIIPNTLYKYLPYTMNKCNPKEEISKHPISLAWFISPKNKKCAFLIEFFRFLFECHSRGFYFNGTLNSDTILYKQYHGYGNNSFVFKLSQKVHVERRQKNNGRKYKDFKKRIEIEGASFLSNFLFGKKIMNDDWYLSFLTDIYYYSVNSGATRL